jgi:hypothetical protein
MEELPAEDEELALADADDPAETDEEGLSEAPVEDDPESEEDDPPQLSGIITATATAARKEKNERLIIMCLLVYCRTTSTRDAILRNDPENNQ